MNYTSAAIGLVTLLSFVTWFTTATIHFSGPSDVRDLVLQGVENASAGPADVMDTKSCK
jgi:hypothetical protein